MPGPPGFLFYTGFISGLDHLFDNLENIALLNTLTAHQPMKTYCPYPSPECTGTASLFSPKQ
jgi:hypothetical protein